MSTSRLKPLHKYVKQAITLDKIDPLVSYYCRMHAMRQSVKIPNKSPEEMAQLQEWMTWLEQNKHIKQDTTPEDAKHHLENFALQVFQQADDVDRTGKATKQTAVAFNTAYILMDVLKQFGTLASDVEEKMKYALWKTTDILKAIKEGRAPVSGPSSDVGAPEIDSRPSNGDIPRHAQHHEVDDKDALYHDNQQSVKNASGHAHPPFEFQAVGRQAYDAPASTMPSAPPPSGTFAYDNSAIALVVQPNQAFAADRTSAVIEAERLVRHALSSLRFDDCPTAIEKLRAALAALVPHNTPPR